MSCAPLVKFVSVTGTFCTSTVPLSALTAVNWLLVPDIVCVPGQLAAGEVLGDPLLKMDGQAVFKLAVGVLEQVARSVLEKAGRTEADIDWLIPHQANIRIMQGTAKKLKLSMDKVIVTVDEHGNTSAASIPLALDVAVRERRIRPGDTVMLEGVGGGFTWGAVLLDL